MRAWEDMQETNDWCSVCKALKEWGTTSMEQMLASEGFHEWGQSEAATDIGLHPFMHPFLQRIFI